MAISYKQVSTLQRIWGALTSLVGVRSLGNPLTDTKVIDEDLTLYVDASGDDGNPGTSDKPFKTIQAQLESLKGFDIRALVTVSVSAGNFAGFHMGNYTFGPKTQAGGETVGLMVQGTMVAPTLTTGTATGTLTSGGQNTVTDTTQNWTVDELKGKFCAVSYNPGRYYPIVSNTATSMTILAQGTSYSAGQTYTIGVPGTAINTAVKTSATPPSTTNVQACVAVLNNPSTVNGTMVLRYLKIDPSTQAVNYGVYFQGIVNVQECLLTVGTRVGLFAGLIGSNSSAVSSVFQMTSAGFGINQTPMMNHTGNYFYSTNGTPAGTGITTQNWNSKVLNASMFENLATGMTSGSGSFAGAGTMTCQSVPSTFKNCTTAIYGGGPCTYAFFSNYVNGSGNTNGIVMDRGARCGFGGTSSIGATNEIVLDGTNYTLAAMRQASPKLVSSTYGTVVFDVP